MSIDGIPNDKTLVIEGNYIATPNGWVEPTTSGPDLLIDVTIVD